MHGRVDPRLHCSLCAGLTRICVRCSEYERIVGDADGGTLFTPEQYEEFKANAIAHRANRIYVSWRNMRTGMDCRMVGPTSPCFCGHRFRQHATDNHNKKMHCRQAGCPCTLYNYIPVRGTQDVKCTCKHSYDVHNVTKARKCKQAGCPCAGFSSSLSCACKDQYPQHETVFETKEERQAQGRPVDNLAGGGAGYEALGGITSFSSLVEGIDRLELGPGGSQEALDGPAPPPRQGKLKAEDEFALYDAKYKGKSSGGSRSSVASSSSSSMAARSSGRAQQPPPEEYDQRMQSANHAAAPAGNDALSLFLTPHSLSSSSAGGALTSGTPRARLMASSASTAAAGGPPRRSAPAGSSSLAMASGSRLR